MDSVDGGGRLFRRRRRGAQPLRLRWRRRFGLLALEVVIGFFAVVAVFPLYEMLAGSLQPNTMSGMQTGIPLPQLNLDSYRALFQSVDVYRSLSNTVSICVATEALLVTFGSMLGYAIGRSGRGFFQVLYVWFLTGLILPGISNLVPLFELQQQLHLTDSRTFVVLLYAAGSLPFSMLIYTGFLKGIPRELEEAAIVDGCGPIGLFFRIVFPLLMPATATLVVITIYGFWDDFLTPLYFLTDTSKFTLITQIFNFQTQHQAEFGPIFALCTVATLPLLVLFVFTQKYLIRGLTMGALKG